MAGRGRGHRAASKHGQLANKGLDKGTRIEFGDGLGLFAQRPTNFDRDIQLVLDGDHDARPCGAVEFGQEDTVTSIASVKSLAWEMAF